MGVSWCCVAIAVHIWLFHPNTVVGFGSRVEDLVDKLGDPKTLFSKLRQLVSLLPKEFQPAGYSESQHGLYMRLLNPENGSAIIGEAGTNLGRGARASVYFVDEAAFISQPELVDAALSQTSNCKIWVRRPMAMATPSTASDMRGNCLSSPFIGRKTQGRVRSGTSGSVPR
jgi:phage terminase large subunit